MAYVEIKKAGRVVARRELDPQHARKGSRIRVGSAGEVMLAIGESTGVGDYEVSVHDGDPPPTLPDGAPVQGDSRRRETLDASASVEAEECWAYPAVEGYEVTGRLGEGGMQVVWRAIQLSTRREVALKLLAPSRLGPERDRLRFEREVELAARLEHPNIARVYDSGVARGLYYYAMELIDGVHLDAYVERHQLSQREVLDLARSVCLAVQHAHQHGVIHRDLKPSNILVTEDGQPHVVDFGLAKRSVEAEAELEISIDGEAAGTPAYMSPEQALGRPELIDTRTDVYSLGVVLYRLLTGQPPHDMTGSRYEVMRRIVEEEVRRPREVCREVDRELESLLLKALAKNPEDRYASAGELGEDIGNYLGGEPLSARAPTTLYFLGRRIRKYRVSVAAACAALAVLVGVAVYSYVRVGRARDLAEAQRVKAQAVRKRAESARARAIAAEALARERLAEAEAARARAEAERAKALAAARKEQEARLALEAQHEQLVAARKESRQHRTLAEQRAENERLAKLEAERERTRAEEEAEKARLARLEAERQRRMADQQQQIAGRQREIALKAQRQTRKRLTDAYVAKGWEHYGRRDPRKALLFHVEALRLAHSGGQGESPAREEELNHRIRVGQVGGLKPVFRTLQHPGGVYAIAFSRVLPLVVTVGHNKTAWLWHADTGVRMTLPGRDLAGSRYMQGVSCMAMSPDGKRLVAPSGAHAAQVWHAQTGRPATPPLEHAEASRFSGRVNHVAFSPDGKLVVTASNDGTARLWDGVRGTTVAPPLRHVGDVNCAAFSPDGKLVVTASDDMTARVWDAGTGRPVTAPLHHGNWVSWAGFSPDGRQVVTASRDRTARVWDAATGWPVTPPLSHQAEVTHAAFSPDGKRVLTASRDHTARVWDTASGKPVTAPMRHAGAVTHASFSPDGKRIVTASDDETARLWDAETGRAITLPLEHGRKVYRARFSPDGRRIATLSGRGAARIWEFPPDKRPIEHLVLYARWRARCRIGPEGTAVSLNPDELREVERALKSMHTGNSPRN